MPIRRIVLDTNVLVAGLRSRQGASHRLLQAIGSGAFDLVLSVPVVLEYEEVLKRMTRSLGLSGSDVDDVLDYLCSVAEPREIHFLWRPLLPDPHDDMVLELAVEARCDSIITFNVRDFAGAESFGIRVLTPPRFLSELGGTA